MYNNNDGIGDVEWSRVSSVSTTMGYGLHSPGIGVRFPLEVRDLSLLHSVHKG
jgi:hypothetical protein